MDQAFIKPAMDIYTRVKNGELDMSEFNQCGYSLGPCKACEHNLQSTYNQSGCRNNYCQLL